MLNKCHSSYFLNLTLINYIMADFVIQHDFNEMLIWETPVIMLRKTEPNMAYGDKASWHFIETVFTRKLTTKLKYTFSKVKLRILLDLVLNVSKLDLRDSGNSVFCSATLSPIRGVNRKF